jgi:hypothetical protein
MRRLRIGGMNVGRSELSTFYFSDFCADRIVYFVGEPKSRDGYPDEQKNRILIASPRGAKVAGFIAESLAVVIERVECSERVVSIWARGGVCFSYLYKSPNSGKEVVGEILARVPEEASLVFGDFNARHCDWDRHTNSMGRHVRRIMHRRGFLLTNGFSRTHKGNTIDLIWKKGDNIGFTSTGGSLYSRRSGGWT